MGRDDTLPVLLRRRPGARAAGARGATARVRTRPRFPRCARSPARPHRGGDVRERRPGAVDRAHAAGAPLAASRHGVTRDPEAGGRPAPGRPGPRRRRHPRQPCPHTALASGGRRHARDPRQPRSGRGPRHAPGRADALGLDADRRAATGRRRPAGLRRLGIAGAAGRGHVSRARARAVPPRATYRLQLDGRFGLREAAQLVPYLAALGVSHAYCSSYLRARAGSTHGYDVVDHNAVDPELGDEPALDAFVAALRRYDMGHVLDFVPNHMGIARADNPWWLEVLEWGPASAAAEWFDIDWRPAKRELHGKVLLPFLGDHYGRVITRGELRPTFDPDTGTLSVWYHEHRFPLAPRTYPAVLGVPPADIPRAARHALARVLAGFAALPVVAQHDAPRTGLVAYGARCQRALARLA